MAEKGHDPMEAYGFGVVAYFNLLRALIFVLFICTVKGFIIMVLYGRSNNEIDLSTAGFMGKLIYPASLSHMSQAETFCQQQFYESARDVSFSCSSGKIRTNVDDLVYGFLKPNALMTDNLQAYNDFCGKSDLIAAASNCTEFVDTRALKDHYYTECFGKTSCSIPMHSYINTQSPSQACTA